MFFSLRRAKGSRGHRGLTAVSGNVRFVCLLWRFLFWSLSLLFGKNGRDILNQVIAELAHDIIQGVWSLVFGPPRRRIVARRRRRKHRRPR